jgi:hypothetical protein
MDDQFKNDLENTDDSKSTNPEKAVLKCLMEAHMNRRKDGPSFWK